MDYTKINWADPKSKISKYFTVEEALFLREWKRMATAEDGLDDTIKKNLCLTAEKLDVVRETLAVPMFIKSWYRPKAYNIAIGGAAASSHMNGEAADFWTDQDGDGDKDGADCDAIKKLLMDEIEEWGLRMEDNGQGTRWVHLDRRAVQPGGHRFFKP